MTDLQLRPSSFPWPPLIYLAAIALAIVAHFVYPLPWFSSPLSDILFAAGGLVILAVVLIDVAAFKAFRRHKTTMRPDRAADHLITDGPFSFTRNPLYLANTLVMIGAGLLTGITWFFVLAVVAGFLTQKLAIQPEEKHLEIRFGKKYRDYAKRVRRWI